MRNVLDQYAHTNKLDIIEKYVQKSTQFSSELEHNDINLQWDDISDKETMEKTDLNLYAWLMCEKIGECNNNINGRSENLSET